MQYFKKTKECEWLLFSYFYKENLIGVFNGHYI